MTSYRSKPNGTGIKKRQAKETSAQDDYMVNYFVQHPHVATNKFQTLHANADLRGSWEQLVAHLNTMERNGKSKDITSWKSGEAMHLLTAGDERILNDIPESLTLRNNEIIEHDVNYTGNGSIPYTFIPDYEVLHDMGNVIEEGSSFNNIQTHSQIQNVETAECHREITEPPSAIQIDDPQRLTTVTQSSSKKRKRPQITRMNGWVYNCTMPEKICDPSRTPNFMYGDVYKGNVTNCGQ
ncbi:hypothetical protein EAI_10397 [Harpegnathos saltator]|uniref:Uncharacterized protein n=1 Tax=Harpegnathos saltator TaxID=610380 RepID=E2B7X2_HARSA|nr:hypothetical protein EAI_10397 [Harpegnathos saltator]